MKKFILAYLTVFSTTALCNVGYAGYGVTLSEVNHRVISFNDDIPFGKNLSKTKWATVSAQLEGEYINSGYSSCNFLAYAPPGSAPIIKAEKKYEMSITDGGIIELLALQDEVDGRKKGSVVAKINCYFIAKGERLKTLWYENIMKALDAKVVEDPVPFEIKFDGPKVQVEGPAGTST